MRDRILIIITGIVIGISAIILQIFGNPANMGFCVACFLRDIAGGLGLHRTAAVQYLRPEIAGIILGAFLAALFAKEFKTSGGSSPVLRFVLGMFMIAGALTFLGCPLRLVIRIAGGDLNALIALPGYLTGIWAGVTLQKKGFTLGKPQSLPTINSIIAPVCSVLLLVLLFSAPVFIFSSTEGPGFMRAPAALALLAGVFAGVLAQRSRLCTVGAFRDPLFFKDFQLFSGILAFFSTAFAGSLITGTFNLSFSAQPIAHSDGIWNFLGMTVVGLSSVLAGGCPLRQLILSGQGDSDAFMTVLGLLSGAALMHNFGLAATSAGVSAAGGTTVILSLAVLLIIGFSIIYTGKKNTVLNTVSNRTFT